MKLTRLESGHWHARWSNEAWAQWPCHRPVRSDDFFNADWTFTPERMAECDKATAEARAPEKPA